jgi:drug/metabolite transporter (DMT)-like permease
LAVLLLYAALRRGSVGVVSPLVATCPRVNLVLSRILLNEERGGGLVAGVAVTVAGAVLMLLA